MNFTKGTAVYAKTSEGWEPAVVDILQGPDMGDGRLWLFFEDPPWRFWLRRL